MGYLSSLPPGATLLDVFKAFPETNKPLIEFHEVLMRGPSPFTEAERELIAAYVSGLNRCGYCRGVHTATAERLGTPEGAVQQLIEEIETAAVPEKMRAVLSYARKLTREPDGVTEADAEAVTVQLHEPPRRGAWHRARPSLRGGGLEAPGRARLPAANRDDEPLGKTGQE